VQSVVIICEGFESDYSEIATVIIDCKFRLTVYLINRDTEIRNPLIIGRVNTTNTSQY
jgi:hypothetical protein